MSILLLSLCPPQGGCEILQEVCLSFCLLTYLENHCLFCHYWCRPQLTVCFLYSLFAGALVCTVVYGQLACFDCNISDNTRKLVTLFQYISRLIEAYTGSDVVWHFATLEQFSGSFLSVYTSCQQKHGCQFCVVASRKHLIAGCCLNDKSV